MRQRTKLSCASRAVFLKYKYRSGEKKSEMYTTEQGPLLLLLFPLGQPAGAIANTTTSGAPAQEKPKSPASAPRGKARGKKGKGKGKAKPEPPEETDPRKLELIRWVRTIFSGGSWRE